MFAKEGLEGVVAARSSISLIRGDEGMLAYRGYPIEELAENSNFEEVVYLLWRGDLPSSRQFGEFATQMRAARSVPSGVLEMTAACATAHPIDSLRTAVSMLPGWDPDADNDSHEAGIRKGLRLVAMMPVLTAAHARRRSGAIAADPELSHAANLLFMLTGKRPALAHARAFDTAMILQADHGLNASTFAARVTAGTLSDMHSAVCAALAALKGRLHGGAGREVAELLAEIRDESRARSYLERRLNARELIPGFGHRVYKGRDPRAEVLRRVVSGLSKSAPASEWLGVAERVEELMLDLKGLRPNIDFYSAPLYRVLGIEPEYYSAIFACARAPGWVAHILEQHSDNRLIRPLEEYIGPLPRPFVPLADRKE